MYDYTVRCTPHCGKTDHISLDPLPMLGVPKISSLIPDISYLFKPGLAFHDFKR